MVIDIKEIMNTIPHRFPFLLIDKVLELEEGKRAVALKNVTMNEAHFQGHFPGHPVMPGVLIIEAIAQVGVVMALRSAASAGKIVYFAGIDNVRFRKPVVPGDQLIFEVETVWIRGPLGKMKGRAKVNNEIVTEGEFMFSLVDTGEAKVHPTATVHPTAQIAKGVDIGPYSVIGPNVKIGEKTKVGAYCSIAGQTTIGRENVLYQGVTIGVPPQDFKYKGENNEVIIGDKNTIREFVTIHLPSGEGGKTIIGNDNFIMVHAHIPHNCRIGNQVVIGGYVGLAGHTEIGDQATIGGMAGIHQFVRVGRLAMIGAQSKVTQDIPPFMLVDGSPAQVRGINSIGLQRRGVPIDATSEIKKAFKLIYESGKNTAEAATEIKKRLRQLPEIKQILDFLETESKRGISKKTAIEEESEDLLLPDIPELGI
ncbi:MAG: acyl-ACP--UDP-N-acetylglucosamine O-acyltransferase [Candidatus Margulisbacteria bacterium]|nr:acyl-ACP--UDP-N-acetylglucosamine O-acyltransferase [Candidatus Margulisiibacteriota bacterium]MBU1616705.1 acyl-ACP--UDP-N-acetylglucosamine O-acyltransferase [Candidatus Margulisiibacteriota bacterium]MBU1867721.1 acyl-ACP--UDP-N-acetylglucosamine O-acyltransferase [Candidatus Margulisiibacteriota bacterium]